MSLRVVSAPNIVKQPRKPRAAAPLMDYAIKPTTAKRYRKSVQDFIEWIINNDDDAVTSEEFDDLLVEYIHYLHDSGYSKSSATHTMAGIVHYMPELIYSLPRSRRCMKGWMNKQPSIPYSPITWEMACVLGIRLSSNGMKRAGIGVLLAFDCLLRLGELLGLKKEDVADDHDQRMGSEHKGMFLRLKQTKTGRNKSVEVLNPQVKLLLRDLVNNTAPKQHIFPYSQQTFRRAFKNAAAEVGLSDSIVPHSLRHSGATRLYHVCKWEIARIAHHGRWASVESARHYLQQCVALLMAQEVPRTIKLGISIAKDLVLSFSLSQKHL